MSIESCIPAGLRDILDSAPVAAGITEPEGIPMNGKNTTHERCPSCEHVQPLHPDGGFFSHRDPASGQPCPVNLNALLAEVGAR